MRNCVQKQNSTIFTTKQLKSKQKKQDEWRVKKNKKQHPERHCGREVWQKQWKDAGKLHRLRKSHTITKGANVGLKEDAIALSEATAFTLNL